MTNNNTINTFTQNAYTTMLKLKWKEILDVKIFTPQTLDEYGFTIILKLKINNDILYGEFYLNTLTDMVDSLKDGIETYFNNYNNIYNKNKISPQFLIKLLYAKNLYFNDNHHKLNVFVEKVVFDTIDENKNHYTTLKLLSKLNLPQL